MTTTTRSREVQDFLDGVTAALADLPQDDRADLLDEVAVHVDEVAAESDAPLTERLGGPVEYSAELRASAGLPPTQVRPHRLAALRGRLRAARRRPLVAGTESFLAALRPLWWVVRAWVAVALVAMFPGQSTPTWSGVLLVVPRVQDGSVGLLVLLLAVIASVQIGRRDWSHNVAVRRAVLVLNVIAALALGPVVASLSDASRSASFGTQQIVWLREGPRAGVMSDGEPVRNIYAYDAEGRLLTDVRLYDEHGQPLDVDLGEDSTRRVLVDRFGVRVTNSYPIRYFEPGTGVVENPVAAPRIVVPPLVAAPMTTATPTSTASPTPSATPSGENP